MAELRMPSLGADMQSGTLVEWLVKPGATVKRGDPVAIVETDKGNIDVEIWEGGTVQAVHVAPGTTVPVGTLLLTLGDGAAKEPAAPAPLPQAAPPPQPQPREEVSPAPRATRGDGHVRASPAARQLARERGIELSTLHGTGPSGAITRGDVERAQAPAMSTPDVHAGLRRAIAAAMARAKREIPHYYVGSEIDLSALATWLEAENQRRAVEDRLLVVVPIVKAIAVCLRRFPELNGVYRDGVFQASPSVHVGFAIALKGGGLVAPALLDADRKSLGELMAAMSDVAARARGGRLRSSEMTDGTVTVSSLGDRGADTVFGVIYPPQVALIGLGSIRQRPWAEGGMLGVRPILHATVAADHRVSDGQRAARFLSELAASLRRPEAL